MLQGAAHLYIFFIIEIVGIFYSTKVLLNIERSFGKYATGFVLRIIRSREIELMKYGRSFTN